MVDWVAGLADASIAERDSGFMLVRIPGSPDVLKEAAVAGFVTKDSGGNASVPGINISVGTTTPLAGAGGNVRFRDDTGTFRWLIGHLGGAGATALSIYDNVNAVVRFEIPASGAWLPGQDNTQNIGSASMRMATVFAGTGTINTSDEREKTWRGALTDAEYAAGLEIFNELGFYQFTEAVDRKGADGARYHFGARAQRVWAIFAKHGLAPKIKKNGKPEGGILPPGPLCFDEWDDEVEEVLQDVEVEVDVEHAVPTGLTAQVDGKDVELWERVTRKQKRIERHATGKTKVRVKAGYRYGFRIDQLNSLLIAVLARRQDELESRIAALGAV